MQDMMLSDSIWPKSSSGRLFCDDLGQGIMIRQQPRASDGVAGPRLQS